MSFEIVKIPLSILRRVDPISQSQFDTLYFESYDVEGFDGVRYWVSRCSVADGEPYNNKVTIEVLTDGRWENYISYNGMF